MIQTISKRDLLSWQTPPLHNNTFCYSSPEAVQPACFLHPCCHLDSPQHWIFIRFFTGTDINMKLRIHTLYIPIYIYLMDCGFAIFFFFFGFLFLYEWPVIWLPRGFLNNLILIQPVRRRRITYIHLQIVFKCKILKNHIMHHLLQQNHMYVSTLIIN